MPGQVMEAPLHQQLPPMPVALMPPNCKHHATTMAMAAATAADDVSCLQPLPASASANAAAAVTGGREQCPRCASHDTKFCYYNNYNTSQPRHFCRACRRYWTLGGSLRNVPIGGSTRKRPRMAPPAVRRPLVHLGTPPPMPPLPSQQGLLGSLFALGAAPLLEGRIGFDLGLGLPGPGQVGHAGAAEVGLHGLGLRGGPAGTSAPLLWPTGLLENDNVDTWKVPGTGAGAIWPEFSAAAAAAAAQAGGLLHGGTQML